MAGSVFFTRSSPLKTCPCKFSTIYVIVSFRQMFKRWNIFFLLYCLLCFFKCIQKPTAFLPPKIPFWNSTDIRATVEMYYHYSIAQLPFALPSSFAQDFSSFIAALVCSLIRMKYLYVCFETGCGWAVMWWAVPPYVLITILSYTCTECGILQLCWSFQHCNCSDWMVD